MTTSDLTCREFVEVITDFHELALPPGDRIRVEQHLVVCSACTRYEQQLRATVRVAATIELDDLETSSATTNTIDEPTVDQLIREVRSRDRTHESLRGCALISQACLDNPLACF